MTMAGLPASIADPTSNREQTQIGSSADASSKGPASSSKQHGGHRPSRADSPGMTMAGLPTGIADPTTKRQGKSKAQPKGGSTAGSAKAADHDAAGEHIAFSNMQPFAR